MIGNGQALEVDGDAGLVRIMSKQKGSPIIESLPLVKRSHIPIHSGRAILVTVAVIAMLAPLNSTMIAVALPRIIDQFQSDPGHASWLVTIYLIMMASLQPIAGKMGDRFGRRRLVLGGLLYFGLASGVTIFASSLVMLIFWRAQQALAASLALPNAMALIRETAPQAELGKWYGVIGAAFSLAAALGPLVGGALVSLAGWPTIFSLNILLIIPALWLGWRCIPIFDAAAGASRAPQSFDWLGAAGLSTLLVTLAWLFVAQRQTSMQWGTTAAGASLLGVMLALFLVYEARHSDPILPPQLFRIRAFASANLAVAASNLAMYVTLLATPLLLAGREHWSDAQTGLMLSAMFGATMVASPFGGRLVDRWGRRRPTVGGLALLVIGLAPLAVSDQTPTTAYLVASLSLIGIGLGIATPGMQTTAVASVPVERTGLAAGVYSTSRYLGSIVGTSLLPLLLPTQQASGHDFAPVFVLAIAAATVALLAGCGITDR